MSDPSAQRPLINRIEDVDAQLKRVDELYSLLGQLDAYHAEAVKMLLNQTLQAKEPLLDELTRLEAEIRTFCLVIAGVCCTGSDAPSSSVTGLSNSASFDARFIRPRTRSRSSTCYSIPEAASDTCA